MSDTVSEPFSIGYSSFEPDEEGLREALTSTGNGYFCTRGAAEWEDADGVHYPAPTPTAIYNRETTILGGRPVLNEDLVNLPNWLVLKLRIEGEEALRLDERRAASTTATRSTSATRDLARALRFRDRAGRETTLDSRRFVQHGRTSTRPPSEWTLTPENWSGRVEIVSAIDGRVTNRGVARYRELEGRHLDPVSPRTFGPEVDRAQGPHPPVEHLRRRWPPARASSTATRAPLEPERALYQMEDYIQQVLAFDVRAGRAGAGREDGRALHLARPRRSASRSATPGSQRRALPELRRGARRHRAAWDELWQVVRRRAARRRAACSCCCACTSPTSCRSARATPPIRTPGVPARGLNGEAYRGHVFWDELYVFPFLNFRLPEITRELLHVPLPPARRGAGGRARRPASAARCTRGRAAATARRRPRRSTSTRCRGAGSRTSATTSATSTRRSSTTSGTTTRPRTTCVPARPRRGDDARDRAVLGVDRALQPRARPLRDPRRDGPGRVPREVPGRRRGRAAQQRLHQRDGRVDLRTPRSRCSTCSPTSRAEALRARLDLTDEEIAHVGGHEPPDVRAVPRRRHHQPVRGLRASSRSSTGTPTASSTGTSSGSTGSCAPRATTPTATSSPSRPTR